MKKIILMLMVLVSTLTLSEWEKVTTSSSYGDRTWESDEMLYRTNGEFRNSATASSKFSMSTYINQSGSMNFHVTKYNDSHGLERFIGGGFVYLENEKGEKFSMLLDDNLKVARATSVRKFKKELKELHDFLISSNTIKINLRNKYTSEYFAIIDMGGFNEGFKTLENREYKDGKLVKTIKK